MHLKPERNKMRLVCSNKLLEENKGLTELLRGRRQGDRSGGCSLIQMRGSVESVLNDERKRHSFQMLQYREKKQVYFSNLC